MSIVKMLIKVEFYSGLPFISILHHSKMSVVLADCEFSSQLLQEILYFSKIFVANAPRTVDNDKQVK